MNKQTNSLRSRLCLRRLIDRHCGSSESTNHTGKAEAEGAEPVRRRAAEADRRPAVGADEAPAAAPAHPVIGAPLPHIAMHVAQTQLVRRVGVDTRRAPQTLPLRRLACRNVT